MGRLSTTRTPLRSPMPCYWEQRPVALQRRTALGQWYDARSAAWIDIQRRRAPEDHGRGRRGRRDAVPPQRASPSCSTMGTLSSSTSGMSGALVNGRQQQASAEAAKRSVTTERLVLRRLEVMTRAVWEGGPTPFSRNTQYGDCARGADC